MYLMKESQQIGGKVLRISGLGCLAGVGLLCAGEGRGRSDWKAAQHSTFLIVNQDGTAFQGLLQPPRGPHIPPDGSAGQKNLCSVQPLSHTGPLEETMHVVSLSILEVKGPERHFHSLRPKGCPQWLQAVWAPPELWV